MKTINAIIITIISIWNNIATLLGFFRNKKLEAIKKEDLIIKQKEFDNQVDEAVKNGDIDKLNELLD